MCDEQEICSCDHIHESTGGCNGSCGHHHHHEPELPSTNVVSVNVGGGIAFCRVTTYGDAITIACELELDGCTLAAGCLSVALEGVAYDIKKLGGTVEQVGFSAEGERFDEDSEIVITVSSRGVDREDVIDVLCTRLERVL